MTPLFRRSMIVLLCLQAVSLAVVTRDRNDRFVFHFSDDTAHSVMFALWVPDTTGHVLGILMNGGAGGGNGTGGAFDSTNRKIGRKLHLGLLGTNNIDGMSDSFPQKYGYKIIKGLDQIAALGFNPELRNVVLMTSSSSNGGGLAYKMMCVAPSRTLCIIPDVPYTLTPPNAAPESTLCIPSIFVSGTNDGSSGSVTSTVNAARLRGAEWAGIIVQGMGHEHRRVSHIALPLIEKCMAARIPAGADFKAGPVKLKTIPESSGWLGDPSTVSSGCTKIAKYSEYTGDKSKAYWLMDEDMAFIYRAYSSYNIKLALTPPDTAAWDTSYNNFKLVRAGDTVPFTVNDSKLPGWTKIELYRGATKIAEMLPGSPKVFKIKVPPAPVAQPYLLLGYDATGTVYPSWMFTLALYDPLPPAVAVGYSGPGGARPVRKMVQRRQPAAFDIAGRAAGAGKSVAGIGIRRNGTGGERLFIR